MGCRAAAIIPGPAKPELQKKKSLMPQTIMGTILISLMVVTTNRLIWRRLYRLAETRYKLEG